MKSSTIPSAGAVCRSSSTRAATFAPVRPWAITAQPSRMASRATAAPTEPLAPATSITGRSVIFVTVVGFVEIGEAGDAGFEAQPHLAGRAVALLADDQLGQAMDALHVRHPFGMV